MKDDSQIKSIDLFSTTLKKEKHFRHIVKCSLQDAWCGDCLKLLKSNIPKSSVDVVVTSPPYNIDAQYGQYDDKLDNEKYILWLKDIFLEIKRVLKNDGSFFLNVGSIPTKPWIAMDIAMVARNLFKLQNDIVWIKSLHVAGSTHGHFKPIQSKRFLNHTFEKIFHFTKTGHVELDKLSIGVGYVDKSNIKRWKSSQTKRCRGNSWFLPYSTIVNREQRGGHPATFPVHLPEYCIKLHGVKKDMTVLDPFMGIGTTLMAAQSLGVKAIGIDIDKNYVQIVKKKLGIS